MTLSVWNGRIMLPGDNASLANPTATELWGPGEPNDLASATHVAEASGADGLKVPAVGSAARLDMVGLEETAEADRDELWSGIGGQGGAMMGGIRRLQVTPTPTPTPTVTTPVPTSTVPVPTASLPATTPTATPTVPPPYPTPTATMTTPTPTVSVSPQLCPDWLSGCPAAIIVTLGGLSGTCDATSHCDCASMFNGPITMFNKGSCYQGMTGCGFARLLCISNYWYFYIQTTPSATVCAYFKAPNSTGCPPADGWTYLSASSACAGGTMSVTTAPTPTATPTLTTPGLCPFDCLVCHTNYTAVVSVTNPLYKCGFATYCSSLSGLHAMHRAGTCVWLGTGVNLMCSGGLWGLMIQLMGTRCIISFTAPVSGICPPASGWTLWPAGSTCTGSVTLVPA